MLASIVTCILTCNIEHIAMSMLAMACSSSYILFSKTYDWKVILALKRKKLDKAIGIHTGCYFKSLMTITCTSYVTSIIYLFIRLSSMAYRTVIILFAVCTLLLYITNIYKAYKADPDKVLKE